MSGIIKDVRMGDQRLILGDCLEVMREIEGNYSGVTDPPYGIGLANGFGGFGGFGKPIARKQYRGDWDNVVPSAKIFNAFLSITDFAVIFGGNYFTDSLPVGKQWLVWDKKNTMPTFSDCELAWTNFNRKSVKLLTYEYNGLIGKREKRVHPTQKPVEVMIWAIEKFPRDSGNHILDPFMGSGTTLVACAKLGRKGTGIELDPEYFEIACKRVEEAYRQADMFVAPPEKPIEPTQIDMLANNDSEAV